MDINGFVNFYPFSIQKILILGKSIEIYGINLLNLCRKFKNPHIESEIMKCVRSLVNIPVIFFEQ